MQAITLIIKFQDGTEMAFIGPKQAVPESEVEQLYFSEPHEMPDCSLQDISGFRFEKITSH